LKAPCDASCNPRIGYLDRDEQQTRKDIVSAGPGGFRAKGEEAIGDLAQALLENPLFSQALGKALGAGERAAQAQRAALGALDVSSASDTERLGRRVRALSDRVEVLEDALDEVRRELDRARRDAPSSSA
jgi:hypothetical protein